MQKGFAPAFILIGIVVLAAIGGVYYFGKLPVKPADNKKACTLEAKICPDGSAVGRTGPNCEFALCPAVSSTPADETASWETYSNLQYGFQIKHPHNWKVDRDEKGKLEFKSLTQFSKTNPKTFYNFIIKVDQKTYSSLLDELKNNVSRYQGTIITYKFNEQVDAQKAVMVTGAGGSDYIMNIIFKKNNIVFQIQANFINPPEKAELDEFDQILSTLKFTQ